jgi:hypothetical protein
VVERLRVFRHVGFFVLVLSTEESRNRQLVSIHQEGDGKATSETTKTTDTTRSVPFPGGMTTENTTETTMKPNK